MLRALLLPLFVTGLLVAEEATGLAERLPRLAPPVPVPAEDHGESTDIAPGIVATATAVILAGVTLIDSGPVDGMEVVACLDGGKAHESLIRLISSNGQLVKFAVIRVLGLDDGVPAQESSGVPARGTPVRVRLEWPVGDPAGPWQAIDASSLVRDRLTDQPYPAVPFIYTGSRIVGVIENGPDGRPVRRDRFMLDATKSVAVVFDEADALLASPFLNADIDSRYEANSALMPRPGMECRMVLSAAELPLTLVMDAQGALVDQSGAAIDDAGLRARLQQAFPASYSGLRAIAIHVVDPATPSTSDVAVRARVIEAAADVGVWAIPVFVPGPPR